MTLSTSDKNLISDIIIGKKTLADVPNRTPYLMNNKEFVLELAKGNGMLLADKEWNSGVWYGRDVDIAIAAYKNNPACKAFIKKDLFHNLEFMLQIYEIDLTTLSDCSLNVLLEPKMIDAILNKNFKQFPEIEQRTRKTTSLEFMTTLTKATFDNLEIKTPDELAQRKPGDLPLSKTEQERLGKKLQDSTVEAINKKFAPIYKEKLWQSKYHFLLFNKDERSKDIHFSYKLPVLK